jgi:thiol-disulfide isomerase/thioredoxin
MRAGLVAGVIVLAAAASDGVLASRGKSSGPTGRARATALVASQSAPVALSGTDPVTGKLVSLASFRGKPIVLNAWASWCTGCAAEARALGQFERTHPQAQVLGLDIRDSKGGAKSFYRRFGWRHPSIFDPQGVLAVRLGVQGLPTTFFLDRRHRIVATAVGETNLAGFVAGFKRALG